MPPPVENGFHFDVALSGVIAYLGDDQSGPAVAVNPEEVPGDLITKFGCIPRMKLQLIVPRRAVLADTRIGFETGVGYSHDGQSTMVVDLPRGTTLRFSPPNGSTQRRLWTRHHDLADAVTLSQLRLSKLKEGLGEREDLHEAEWARIVLPKGPVSSRMACREKLADYKFLGQAESEPVADRFNWRGQYSGNVRIWASFPRSTDTNHTDSLEINLAPREGDTLGVAVIYHADLDTEAEDRASCDYPGTPVPFDYAHAFAALVDDWRNYERPILATDWEIGVDHIGGGGCPPLRCC